MSAAAGQAELHTFSLIKNLHRLVRCRVSFQLCDSLNEFSFWSTFRVIGEHESNMIELFCLRPPACRLSCKPFAWHEAEIVGELVCI